MTQLLEAETCVEPQGRQHLQPAVCQVVVGVKDATSQFDQFAVVTQQQQILHTGFRSSHQHRSKPVTHLQQWR